MAARPGFCVMNVDDISTFGRPGYSEMISDITLAMRCTAATIKTGESSMNILGATTST